ncbi:hypothetical protein LX69_02198 [Breznakibacter xylanolyticus]|uniref:Lipoprotein n=1 Tax=Breznakibacter xylanolyticus TaxID=990 RepID=A0A2W7N5L6_9BACT|nr:hypothetical protein [Breznakibacter xylanolyticus]PZX15360.1 hypothetical protein LX69_02198 [Breznakibacter xylanolyticus]
MKLPHVCLFIFILLGVGLVGMLGNVACSQSEKSHSAVIQSRDSIAPVMVTVDSVSYLNIIDRLANGDTSGRWPVKNQPFPPPGALLPFHRIVAYYGNLYSRRMGILGEYPPDEVWRRLNLEVQTWQQIDSLTPVQPAIHYIAVVAQGHPMKDSSYCMRMPDHQIDSALAIAKMGKAILFLDIQVGHSTVMSETPRLDKYLRLPNVHLGVDPEFSMKDGEVPGRVIGYLTADDINFCIDHLAALVDEYKLPPKILVVHRFTQGMVKHYRQIKLHPNVQVVINMDGWGEPVLKYSTYKDYIFREPVQFTGFKIFYKNDLRKSPHRLLTAPELMKLKPQPIYIQYQ